MIVQCSYCGAPLDVKSGDRVAKCAYCGRTERVKGMETLHMQTPQGWAPPQQWVPPAGVKIQVQTPLVYHAPGAGRSAALTLFIVAATLVPMGIGLVAALSTSGAFSSFAALGGLDASAAPTLGVFQTGSAPGRRTFTGVTAGTVERTGEFGKYASAPTLLLRVTKRSLVELGVHSTNDTTLLVRFPSGVDRYDDDGGDGHDPHLSMGLEPGSYPVWVGNRNEGVAYDLTVSAFAVKELPGPDGLAWAGPPMLADVTLGPTADPIRWTTPMGTSVDTRFCNSRVTPLPQVLVRTTTPRVVTIRAHGNFDATLLLRDPTGRYVCDDDSGDGNDPRIELSLPVGVSAIWVGDLHGQANTADVMLVVEPHVPGEAAPAPMLMPEAPATQRTADLDELVRRRTRDFTVQGQVHGYLAASSLGPGCPGHLTSSPTVSLRTSVARRVVVRARGPADLVLASRSPTGVPHCNDDSGGRDPRLEFELEPGETDFWVGPYNEGVDARYVLSVAVPR